MIYISEMRLGDTQPRNPMGDYSKPWCRMQSNIGVSELDRMADRIGISRYNFCGNKWSFYYPLNEKQRKAALEYGAMVIKLWEFPKLCFVSNSQAKTDLEYLADPTNGKHKSGMLTEAKRLLKHWETREEERHLRLRRQFRSGSFVSQQQANLLFTPKHSYHDTVQGTAKTHTFWIGGQLSMIE